MQKCSTVSLWNGAVGTDTYCVCTWLSIGHAHARQCKRAAQELSTVVFSCECGPPTSYQADFSSVRNLCRSVDVQLFCNLCRSIDVPESDTAAIQEVK